LIAFLFLVAFRPATELLRRYRHNWQVKDRLFTIVEGSAFFIVGWITSAYLNGSLPHSRSGYSRSEALALLVWVPSLVFFLISAFIYSYQESTRPPTPVEIDDLIDMPIADDEQDILGRKRFVDDFFAQIKEFPFHASFVFGLNGTWGTGKTSALNLLRNRLRKEKAVILVDFNPWYFQTPEVIIRRFYDSVAAAINHEFFYPELRSTARRYARILAPVLKLYGIDFASIDDATVEEVKGLVESYIVRTGRRIVVIVDDLERASREELTTTLQIVRLSANFQNTLFVLAYDHMQLSQQLKRQGISPDFINKIVQYPIDLPAADKNAIDRFLIYSDSRSTSHLDKLLNELKIDGERRKEFDEGSATVYPGTVSPFFPTLRNVKRFLIGLSARLPAVKDEVHLLDFFLLEILRVFAPSVHHDIWNNPYFYIPSWTTKSMLSSPFGIEFDSDDRNSRREKIKEHVNDLLRTEPLKANILEILKKLFVVRIADAFDRPGRYGDTAEARFRAQKRLTHPESFEKYFLLAVPEGIVPDAAVEEMLDSWTKDVHPEEAILEAFAKLSESGQLVETIDRIIMFLGRVSEKLARSMLSAASQSIKSAPPPGDRSEQNVYFKLILSLLDEKIAESEKQAEAAATIHNISQIDVAVRLIQALLNDDLSVVWSLRQQLKLEPLKAIVRERFSKEFVEPKVDIVELNPMPYFVLYQVGSYDSAAKEMINEYVSKLFEKTPSHIGQLISGFFLEFQTPDGFRTFNFDLLKAVYDTRMIVEHVRRVGDKAWSSDKEKEAVERFMKEVDRQPPTEGQ
jgi:hypothetical protein